MFCLFIMYKDYASDTEWSRYMVINLVLWIGLVGFLFADYLTVVSNLSYYSDDPDNIFKLEGTEKCIQLFQVNVWCNLIVAIIATVLALLLIFKIFIITKNFFIVKYYPHTAISEDDDIIVIE